MFPTTDHSKWLVVWHICKIPQEMWKVTSFLYLIECQIIGVLRNKKKKVCALFAYFLQIWTIITHGTNWFDYNSSWVITKWHGACETFVQRHFPLCMHSFCLKKNSFLTRVHFMVSIYFYTLVEHRSKSSHHSEWRLK